MNSNSNNNIKAQVERIIQGLDQQISVANKNNSKNIADSRALNDKINQGLQGIKGAVEKLQPLIDNLRRKIDELKNKSVSTGDYIGDNTEEIRQLKERINELMSEIQKGNNENRLYREHLSQLHSQQQLMNQEITRLKEQLGNTGAETESIRQELNERNNRIQQFQKAIQDQEQLFRERMQQWAQKEENYERTIQQLNESIAIIKQQNVELTQQKVVLDKLIEQSIDAIGRAGQALTQVQDQKINTTQYDAILSDIRNTIDQVGQALTELNSNSPGNSASSSRNPGRIPLNTEININGQNFTLGSIIDQLITKNKQMQGNPSNKYANALNNIRIATTPESIPGILKNNGIYFNNGRIIGGKLSKKSRKTKRKLRRRRQKGGYTYNKNAQRRTFSSKSSSPRSSSSSKSSSKTSSLHKDKARGSKTRKTL